MDCPSPANGFQAAHAQRLLDSYETALGRPLLTCVGGPADLARALFQADFIVLSHSAACDPILTYGNRAALALWETDWETLTKMPSRLTAETDHREGRAQMLASISEKGFIDAYEGIRISTKGRRFRIADAVIWTLKDAQGTPIGQAATFAGALPLLPAD